MHIPFVAGLLLVVLINAVVRQMHKLI
jgi:hypothetical protein